MTWVDHVAAVVRDLESAKEFFIDAFGFTPGQVNEMKSLGIRSVFMKGENIEIELIQPVSKGPYWEYLEKGLIGFNHIALEVEDSRTGREEAGEGRGARGGAFHRSKGHSDEPRREHNPRHAPAALQEEIEF